MVIKIHIASVLNSIVFVNKLIVYQFVKKKCFTLC